MDQREGRLLPFFGGAEFHSGAATRETGAPVVITLDREAAGFSA